MNDYVTKDDYQGGLNPDQLAKRHAELREQSVPIVIELLGGTTEFHAIGKEFIGNGDKYTSLTDLTKRYADFNPITKEYEGPLAEVYFRLTNADINTSSTTPFAIMYGCLAEALTQEGFRLSSDEKSRRQSILASKPIVWTLEKKFELQQLVADPVHRTWKEIGELLGVTELAVQKQANNSGIQKMRLESSMTPERLDMLAELLNSGKPYTLETIAYKLGLRRLMANPAQFLYHYMEEYGIERPHLPSLGSKIRGLKRGKYFEVNDTRLKDILLRLKEGQAPIRIREEFNIKHATFFNLVDSHLKVEDKEGENRLRTPEELDEYIKSVQKEIEDYDLANEL